MKNKTTIKKHKQLVAKAINRIFDRTNMYPQMTLADMRKAINKIPSEYDDCVLSFGFVLSDKGEDPVGSGFHNFEMGFLPIKTVIMHPDQNYVVFCDDELTDFVVNKTKRKLF